tara:strand:- start:737 stop:1288 length:552 start_codon:yes stop_codon:yes gene_type:complete
MTKIRRSRLGIWQKLLNNDIEICFEDKLTKRNYCYPIDEFKKYLGSNTNVFNTKSWTENGVYHWPRVPDKYYDEFLNQYEVKKISDNLPVSQTRDYNPDARNQDLEEYIKKHGHCYVDSSDNNESLYHYIAQKRHQYKSGVMTSDEIQNLRDMNFIFYPELNHYFKAQNKTDRDYLIKILINL